MKLLFIINYLLVFVHFRLSVTYFYSVIFYFRYRFRTFWWGFFEFKIRMANKNIYEYDCTGCRYQFLTTFRSSTPSLASCNKETNFVVKRPKLFSCLLGVLSAIKPCNSMVLSCVTTREKYVGQQGAWLNIKPNADVFSGTFVACIIVHFRCYKSKKIIKLCDFCTNAE